ncbi:hypothetical protein RC083_05595 [Pseudoalteromonas haloplanktis]|uniref:Uncharacterized protein n=1 Tax=Pseudoalteromonas haloplanktis TaxID=228 RepID=A0ABU1BBB5_PSEHA|nr:hypothetical protein [Pseudoalteromonas haloplanktis]MDQ9091066.1 hypothetical protein [Pseudoalteromonas haloplanktis]
MRKEFTTEITEALRAAQRFNIVVGVGFSHEGCNIVKDLTTVGAELAGARGL